MHRCIFEEAVSYDVVVWSHAYGIADASGTHAKVYLVDEHGTASAVVPAAEDGAERGMEEVAQRIAAAHFTGRGDKESVLGQYASFRVTAHEAAARIAEKVAGARA